jgi:DNA-binding MarR family transcriptional regulator
MTTLNAPAHGRPWNLATTRRMGCVDRIEAVTALTQKNVVSRYCLPRGTDPSGFRGSVAPQDGAGLTTAQHQLLLAIRGHPGEASPTVGDIADHLVLRHHSAGELIDRAEAAGLVARSPDPINGTQVRVSLTETGMVKLTGLAETHLAELAHLAPTMRALWKALEANASSAPGSLSKQTRHESLTA